MSERNSAGASGHPEPGSAHDDTKTETVADGPATPAIDGVPGASGNVDIRGGAATETETHGAAADVATDPDA